MQKSKKKAVYCINIQTLISILIILCMIFVQMSDTDAVLAKSKAKDSLKFAKSKYTYYEGNTSKLSLTYNGIKNFQDTDEFHSEWEAGFSSSDETVIRVSFDGSVTCLGTGSAVVTAEYKGLKATCKIVVKANSLSISSEELILFSNQSADVRISGISGFKTYDYDTWSIGANYGYPEEASPYITIKGDGSFNIRAGRAGDHIVRLIGIKKSGKSYSRRLVLHVIEAGPSVAEMYVASGCENKLEMLNSTLISSQLIEWYDGEETYSSKGKCPINYEGKGWFSALSGSDDISARFRIKYKTDNGAILYTEILVSSYSPVYEQFEDFLKVGKIYEPSIVSKGLSSKIVCTSSDPDVLKVDEFGNLIPVKSGQVTLIISIDGKEFADAIDVIDVKISGDNLFTWPGCVFSYGVSGVPSGTKVKYLSTNENVATISKKGKLKIKAEGFTTVIVQIGKEKNYYSVNVGNETTVKAVQAAEAVVGKAKYSQDRRMEDGYYDCSSLVWRSYAKAGVKLKFETYAPTAAELAEYLNGLGYTIATEAIPAEELLPGDLIFSSTGSDNGRYKKIDHVAIYHSNVESFDESGNSTVKGQAVHAGKNGGGVYISTYPGFMNVVMIARLK